MRIRKYYLILFLCCLLLISCAEVEDQTIEAGDRNNVIQTWPAPNESVDAQPVLQWASFPGAIKYRVAVTDLSSNAIALDTETAELFMPVTKPLIGGAQYNWTVQALDAKGDMIGEAAGQFLVKGQIEVVGPGNFEIVPATPTLVWKTYPGAVEYQVVLLDDDAFPPVVVSDTNTKETTFQVASPLEPGSYSWTIWAKDADGVTIAEANNQFIVE